MPPRRTKKQRIPVESEIEEKYPHPIPEDEDEPVDLPFQSGTLLAAAADEAIARTTKKPAVEAIAAQHDGLAEIPKNRRERLEHFELKFTAFLSTAEWRSLSFREQQTVVDTHERIVTGMYTNLASEQALEHALAENREERETNALTKEITKYCLTWNRRWFTLGSLHEPELEKLRTHLVQNLPWFAGTKDQWTRVGAILNSRRNKFRDSDEKGFKVPSLNQLKEWTQDFHAGRASETFADYCDENNFARDENAIYILPKAERERERAKVLLAAASVSARAMARPSSSARPQLATPQATPRRPLIAQPAWEDRETPRRREREWDEDEDEYESLDD